MSNLIKHRKWKHFNNKIENDKYPTVFFKRKKNIKKYKNLQKNGFVLCSANPDIKIFFFFQNITFHNDKL